MKYLKLILSVCLLFLISTESIKAQSISTACENNNINFFEITDSGEIEKYEKQIQTTKNKIEENLKDKGIELTNSSVLKEDTTNITSVIYELKSKTTEIDNTSTLSFSIVNDEITYQYILITNIDEENQHVQLVQNDENLADFVVKNDEYVSGTIKTSSHGTLDVTSKEYQQLIEPEFSTYGIGSFNKCMDKCFDKFNVPKWVQETITVVAAAGCLSLNPVVCASALVPLGSLYGAKMIACVIDCV